MKSALLAAVLAALTVFSATLLSAQDTAAENPILKEVSSKLTSPKKKFSMLVQATVKEGAADKFVAAFAAAIEPTRAEEGCSRYELHRVAGENFSFVVYERWKNLDALKSHMEAAHTKKLLETIAPLLSAPPQIVVMTPEAEPKKEAKGAQDVKKRAPGVRGRILDRKAAPAEKIQPETKPGQ